MVDFMLSEISPRIERELKTASVGDSVPALVQTLAPTNRGEMALPIAHEMLTNLAFRGS